MKLQTPAYVYMGGEICAWSEARLHIGCEAVTRGLNVFEGVKCYRQPDGDLAAVMLGPHYERLVRSARLLHIPCEATFEEYQAAIRQLVRLLEEPGKEMWLRTTLYVTQGHWGEDTLSDLVVTAYQADMAPPEPVNLGVSTWRRSEDVSLPARIKTSTNYQVGRLARIEGRAAGCQDMILLNQHGRVAEATGSCILMVRDGKIVTPPPTEGALESITVDIVEALADSMGLCFVRRPIDRTELLVADEIALCGTLAELVPVRKIERLSVCGESHILGQLQKRYFEVVRGIQQHPSVELTRVSALRDQTASV